jgi:hypothetical protein
MRRAASALPHIRFASSLTPNNDNVRNDAADGQKGERHALKMPPVLKWYANLYCSGAPVVR